jgi:putative salt-induced outer membrane protein YdiY
MVVRRAGPEVFVQAQYNAFTNLRSRMLTGAGGRFDFIHRNLLGVWGGTGYMIEYEVNAVEPSDPHPSETFNHRWTSYLSTRFNLIGDQLQFGSTTYVQPRFDDYSDIRLQMGAQLEAKVGPVFALGADFEVRYDSRPPRGIADTDITLSSYLRFRFG